MLEGFKRFIRGNEPARTQGSPKIPPSIVDTAPYVPEQRPGRSGAEIGTARAEFARQINGFVEIGNHEHALDLIKFAIMAEEGKPQTPEVTEDTAFYREQEQRVIALVKQRREQERNAA